MDDGYGKRLGWLSVLVMLTVGCGGPGGPPGSSSETSAAPLGGGTPAATGDADVSVFLNTSPTITSMTGEEGFLLDRAGRAITVEAQISVRASDAEGDSLSYAWSSPNCPSATFAYPDPSDVRTVLFRHDGQEACEVRVEVRDFWKDLPGPGFPAARGGEAVGTLRLSGPLSMQSGGED